MTRRCGWAVDPLSVHYHDTEWGVPVHDDRTHFEYLILDGAQAGLSWLTILKRREGYRLAFADFDPELVATYGAEDVEHLLDDPGIIRNRMKIEGAVRSAKAFLAVQAEFGSFDNYIWRFVENRTIRNGWSELREVPVTSEEAQTMSKDMVKRGFSFVGPTICYAYMQAAGLVNDHLVDCFRYKEV